MFIEFTNLRKAFFRKRALIALTEKSLCRQITGVHFRHHFSFLPRRGWNLVYRGSSRYMPMWLSNFDLPLISLNGDWGPDSISGRFTWVKWQKLRNGECNVMGQGKYWNAIKERPGINCICDWSKIRLKATNEVSGGHLVLAMRWTMCTIVA